MLEVSLSNDMDRFSEGQLTRLKQLLQLGIQLFKKSQSMVNLILPDYLHDSDISEFLNE